MSRELIRILVVVALIAFALLVVAGLHWVLVRLGRRSTLIADLVRVAHRSTRAFAVLVAGYAGIRLLLPNRGWAGALRHSLLVVLIITAAWLTTELLFVVQEGALARFRTDVLDNRRARKVHTQIRLVRRVTVVMIAIVALGAILVTFPEARYAGTSVLASAGLVGVVTALAAQSVLGNLLAGLQLAFGGALRLDDVVVVEQEWGRIEEITLTYVVVQIWDDRRLILPTSYFTTKPFENWTRTSSALLGAIELDADWTVPVDRIREELRTMLSGNDLWDGRVSVLQVTDATGTQLRLRALVSAADAPRLWDLRCAVREHLIGWLRRHHAEALPRVRADLGPLPAEQWSSPAGQRPVDSRDARAFGGDLAGWLRGEAFTGPQDPDGDRDGDRDGGVDPAGDPAAPSAAGRR